LKYLSKKSCKYSLSNLRTAMTVSKISKIFIVFPNA